MAKANLQIGGNILLSFFRQIQMIQTFFVSSAAKVKQKDLRSMEEKELELLCTSVDEESFGSALADCVLVQDSP